jgi:hypothetical protein
MRNTLAVILLGILLQACAQPAEPKRGSGTVNLAGFPAEFRQGYSDGCSSAHGTPLKDTQRFQGEGQYAQGWRDGFSICQKR